MRTNDTLAHRAKKLSNKIAHVSIQKAEEIDQTTTRVLATYGGELNEAELAKSVAATFDNKVRLADGSAFIAVGEGASALVDMVLVLNTPRELYSEEAASRLGLSAVAQNVFSDAEDNIWSVVGEGDSRMLVQTAKEDLSTVLNTRRSTHIVTASARYALGEPYKGGDALLCYDHVEQNHYIALAMTDHQVYVPALNAVAEVEPVEVACVLEGVLAEVGFNGRNDEHEPLSAENAIDRHLKYMARLYATNGTYFKRLEDLVKQTFTRQAL